MSSLGKLLTYVKSGQFGAIGGALSERVPWWLYHRANALIYEVHRDMRIKDTDSGALPTGYSCRLAAREEMPACCRITGLDVDEYYRRYDAGDICYGVFAGEQPVNINWVHAGPYFVRGMGYIADASESDRYIYGIMTDPAERGKGLYKSCLERLAEYLFANGAERLVQMVEEGNTPVLKTLPQLGYVKTEEISYRSIFGFKRTCVTDCRTGRVMVRRFVFGPRDRFVI